MSLKGFNVAVVDVDEANGEAVASAIRPNSTFIKASVDNYDQQAAACRAAFERWGRLDVVLLNAGIVEKYSLYQLDRRRSKVLPPKPDLACTDVCYKAVVYGTYLAIHFMRQNPSPGGQIIATSSAWGWHGCATSPEYSGAKAAVSHM